MREAMAQKRLLPLRKWRRSSRLGIPPRKELLVVGKNLLAQDERARGRRLRYAEDEVAFYCAASRCDAQSAFKTLNALLLDFFEARFNLHIESYRAQRRRRSECRKGIGKGFLDIVIGYSQVIAIRAF